jgi:hypothetical protein
MAVLAITEIKLAYRVAFYIIVDAIICRSKEKLHTTILPHMVAIVRTFCSDNIFPHFIVKM